MLIFGHLNKLEDPQANADILILQLIRGPTCKCWCVDPHDQKTHMQMLMSWASHPAAPIQNPNQWKVAD